MLQCKELLNKQLECMWAKNCHISTILVPSKIVHRAVNSFFFFFFLQPDKISPDGIVGTLQVMLSMISSMHFVLSIDKIQCHCITVTTCTVLGSILSGEVTKFFA